MCMNIVLVTFFVSVTKIADKINLRKEGRKGYSGSQPITTGKTWQQEYERPGPRESIVRSLRVMNAGSQLTVSPLFSSGPQPMRW